MSLLEFLKDIFGGSNRAFQKLFLPNYFSKKRTELFTIEEYVKWLRKIYAQYGSMAFMNKEKGLQVPQQWLDGLRKIEEQIDKVKKEGGSHLLPQGDGTKLSDELKS